MKKKIISLAAVISMIITLVMPAAVYADEPQEESTAVLKYSVLTSDSEEWKEVTGGETAGTEADDAAEITKLKLNVSDSKSQEDQKTVSYAVAIRKEHGVIILQRDRKLRILPEKQWQQ